MQHAEEGTLHSYLDGELTPAEVVELERHLSVCAPCRAKLTEAKSFLGLSDELITELDKVPAGTKGPASTPKARRAWALRPAALAWAASVVFAAGIGYAWHAQQVGGPASMALQATPDVATNTAPAATQPSERADESVTTPPRAVARRDTPAAQAHDAASPTTLAAAPTEPPAPAPLREEQSVRAAGAAATATGLASKSTGEVRANDNIVMVDGVPVDTAAVGQRQRLAFGPGTIADPKRITMDQAVDLLGGSIQLIDGLTPQRVEVLAGVDVVGADPSRQVVRVYYEEPDLGLVTLDQQRPGPSFDARRPESPTAMPPVSVTPSAPSMARAYRSGLPEPNTMTWRADGVWLSLTTRLPKERMALLQARVK